jgi:hypothetical protein
MQSCFRKPSSSQITQDKADSETKDVYQELWDERSHHFKHIL